MSSPSIDGRISCSFEKYVELNDPPVIQLLEM